MSLKILKSKVLSPFLSLNQRKQVKHSCVIKQWWCGLRIIFYVMHLWAANGIQWNSFGSLKLRALWSELYSLQLVHMYYLRTHKIPLLFTPSVCPTLTWFLLRKTIMSHSKPCHPMLFSLRQTKASSLSAGTELVQLPLLPPSFLCFTGKAKPS